jgi:glycosyltransferase involved in cell wall biosynthesis
VSIPDRHTTVAIVTHVLSTGPADALESYAATRAGRVVFVGHSFADARRYRSFVRHWRDGSPAGQQVVPWSRLVPGPITWAKDVALTVWWGLRTPGMIDVLVGADSLNALAGLILRRLGKVRRVVFWTIDYVPRRFDSRTLNWIYHRLDRHCVRACDETWNLSPRMAEARSRVGIYGRQRVVSMGAHFRPALAAAKPLQIVFVGHLLEKQGVQIVLSALRRVRTALPDARLLIIGDGPYRGKLEALARDLGVEEAAEFTGHIESHDEVERRIAESGVGVAPYDPQIASFSYFADPGKIRNYLGAGVPVVTTDVAYSAREIAARGAGLVVQYDAADLAEALLVILRDPVGHDAFRSAARALGAEADWPVLFDDAFAGLAAAT